MTRLRSIGILAATVLAIAACQVIAPATAIRTSPVQAQACMDALASGTLTRNPQSGLGIAGADGQSMAVEWPFGYGARNDMGRLALVDERGRVVAHEGDEITVGGGFGNQLWHACGPVTVVVP